MNSKFALLFAFSLTLAIFTQIGAEEEEKKLKLALDKLEKVKDAEHIMNTEVTFDRDSDSNEVVINGFIESFVELDDNYKLTFDIFHSTEQDGEMKKVISLADRGVCEIMKNQYKKFFYETLKNYCNAPDPDTCPVPKDKYVTSKYPLDYSKFSNYLRPGFYHMVGTLRHNGEDILQYRVEAHTEEQ